jgi:ankyrin repeat protein
MRAVRPAIGLALLVTVAGSSQLGAQHRDPGLIDAVRRRDDQAVVALLRAKADVNQAQPDGSTALAWAVYLGERRIAEALLDAGARVNVADEYGESPVTLAAANGDIVLLQRLLAKGAPAETSRWNGESALMVAAGAGSVDAVRLLVAHGASVDADEPRRGQTALMWAAAEGHTAVVRTLIEIGANVKAVSKSGFTALAFAVSKDDVESVRLLLAAGLDPNLMLPSGNRLLTIAMTQRHRASALALIDGGADVGVADRAGNRPLHVAAQAGDVELVRRLLAGGAEVDARTPPVRMAVNGAREGGRNLIGGGLQTPLMMAAQADRLPVMRALVAAGADPSLASDNGTTLLMFGAGGRRATAEYAYQLDSRTGVVNKLGQTPMHAAISAVVPRTQAEVCDVIQFLADRGAALDELDGAGRTALSIADGPPIDRAVELLTTLITKSGQTPKIPSKR